MMTPLLARSAVVERLTGMVLQGQTVLVYGPVGSGKTTVLNAVGTHARSRKIPCGIAQYTATLTDLTNAMAYAYTDIDVRIGTPRQLRARLRNAAERQPGMLLLDHLAATGTAFKGALRGLRGMGVGILLAADVDHPRDHERIRGLGLTHHELELPRLHGHSIRSLLKSILSRLDLPFSVNEDDLRDLAAATEGLPGRAVWFANALTDATAWRGGRPRCDWLRSEHTILASESYRPALERAG